MSNLSEKEKVALTAALWVKQFCPFDSTSEPFATILRSSTKNIGFFKSLLSSNQNQRNSIVSRTASFALIERVTIPFLVNLKDFDIALFHKYYWALLSLWYIERHRSEWLDNILKEYSDNFNHHPLIHSKQFSSFIGRIQDWENLPVISNLEAFSLSILSSVGARKDTGEAQRLAHFLESYVTYFNATYMATYTKEDFQYFREGVFGTDEVDNIYNIIQATIDKILTKRLAPLPYESLSNEDKERIAIFMLTDHTEQHDIKELSDLINEKNEK